METLRPLLAHIAVTARLIDRIVYQLYRLTEKEIAVVEGRWQGDAFQPPPTAPRSPTRGEPMLIDFTQIDPEEFEDGLPGLVTVKE